MKGNTLFIGFILISWLLLSVIPSHAQLARTCNSINELPDSCTPVSSTFAVISDYGVNNSNEAAIANLVKSWQPQFIITSGDNNYPVGSASTIDANVGKYYHDYINPYTGTYGSGAAVNSFFPVLGNHDLMTSNGAPYLQYFTLPGNERYYDFIRGDIHFFAINSNPSEPDGTSSTSTQATWLKNKLAASTSKWKIVYFHHPPFCSDDTYGNHPWMQWPFKAWGADAVMSGHAHVYERIVKDNLPYFVVGLGGHSLYAFSDALVEGSQKRYNQNYGALKVTVTSDSLAFSFYNILSNLIDSYTLGINELAVTETEAAAPFKVFPNPNTSGRFTIEIKNSEPEIKGWEVYNVYGEKVHSSAQKNNHSEVDISNQPNGLYILHVTTDHGSFSQKVIIQK